MTYLIRLGICMSIGLVSITAYCQEIPIPAGRRFKEIVRSKYAGNVYIGATTGWDSLKKGEGIILNREFSYITPDNDFKQHQIHPMPEKWKWDIADQWVKSAEKNGQLIRMHAPIGPQCSKWAKNDDRTANELKKNLTEYMTRLCKRYNGKKAIRWLDVVNETIDKNGDWFAPKPGIRQWENPWLKIGLEKDIPSQYKLLSKDGVPFYIIEAFKIATKLAPDLKLIINQHVLIEEAPARKLKELVLYLRNRGFRVDGIGWQAHLIRDWQGWANKNNQNLKTLEELIKWAHENDLEFHVTENNIYLPNTNIYDADTIASVFANIVRTLVTNSDSGVVAWNLWNIKDRPHHKYKKKLLLGLWDKDFNPQKAYYEIQTTLESGGR